MPATLVMNECVELGPEISDGTMHTVWCRTNECYALGLCERIILKEDIYGSGVWP